MIYILLPSYNEEKNLLKIFRKIENIKYSKITVVVVDDCSKDNTYRLVKKKYKFKLKYVRHKKNKGLSLTLETGFREINKIATKNDLVVTMDSDNTHPVETITKMQKKIMQGYELAIASRFVKNSKVNGLSSLRKFMSNGAKYLFKLFYPYKNLNDYTCNYRMYKHSLIKKIIKNKSFFKNEDFNIAAKIILFLLEKTDDLKLVEIPFVLNYQYKIGQSKMRLFRTIFLTIRLILFKKI